MTEQQNLSARAHFVLAMEATNEDERRLIHQLVAAMVGKLIANRHKNDVANWLERDRVWLVDRLIDETQELEDASGQSEIRSEAGDVANFAAMILDLAVKP